MDLLTAARRPAPLLAAFVLAFLPALGEGAGSEEKALMRRHCPFGPPSTGELLFRKGYVLSHNNWLKIPNWVAYHLPREKLSGREERLSRFQPDPDLKPHQRARTEDYKGSGYDRGHLAPAGDMKSDALEMAESFFLSNIAPQIGPGFNRGIWKDLEERIRRWARERKELWVVTGPVMAPNEAEEVISFKIIGKSRVAVPTHFFKIVYARDDEDALRVIAFLLPNAEVRAGELEEAIVAVDRVEDYTGLDFFRDLDDSLEESIESARARGLESW